ncbi:MAG: hypothetical protein ACYDAR_14605 [Thermomicrobiales bacterium]
MPMSLIPAGVREVLLRAAEKGLCRVRWSNDILAEVAAHLPDFIHGDGDDMDVVARIKQRKALDTITAMRTAFVDALVVNYERHIERMTNNPKDRHVAAAAYEAGAEIVTFNLKDFRRADLAPFKLRARP